ncbi:MAG: DUF3696 domain-containing protein [Prevotella sp.]|nr:DUF3696 domain-containing protein [Prevotella sp.]
MLRQINFRNYKAFAENTKIELRPITVLLGKNSSGKSSICKLVSVLASALSGNARGILPLRNSSVVLGGRYEDLFFANTRNGLVIELSFNDGSTISVEYLMNDGEFLLRSYTIGNGQQTFSKQYKSSEESKSDDFVGLTQNKLFEEIGQNKETVSLAVDYIGPLRRAAKRAVFSTDIMNIAQVGYYGENTPYMLLNSHLRHDGLLLKQVSDWYGENMDGQSLDIIENGSTSGSYSIVVRRGNAVVNLADVGEGTNQLLPIITQSYASNADLIIVEQPALHLHPSAHAQVAYRLAESAIQSGKTYLVESHSENFVLGLRNLVAKGKLPKTDVALYFIDHDGESATAQLIEIEDDGGLTEWPEGIFEEDFELLKEIRRGKGGIQN